MRCLRRFNHQCFEESHRIKRKPVNVGQTGMCLVQRLRFITGLIHGTSYVVMPTVSPLLSSSSLSLSGLQLTRCQTVRPRSSVLPVHRGRLYYSFLATACQCYYNADQPARNAVRANCPIAGLTLYFCNPASNNTLRKTQYQQMTVSQRKLASKIVRKTA